MGWKKIESFNLKYDYCCGCGVCAGICTQGTLQMRFNEYGEYRPYLTGKCTDCGLCAKVCPFIDGNPNENELARKLYSEITGIKHSATSGYCLDAFVGHVADISARINSASGGMATWLLETLLLENSVDYVLCVVPNDDSEQMFRYKVCKTVEEVRDGSRSCYYPLTTQDVLSFVTENDGRYAIVGLPCVCRAIRLAQNQSKKIRDRIKYLVGLVCGQTKSKFFVEHICALGGADPHNLKKVQFRIKDIARPASDYGLKYFCEDDGHAITSGTVFWAQGMNKVWVNRHFTPNACDFCDDIFAECADIVFMDAWLPQYRKDWRGHNIALCRRSEISGLLRNSNGTNLVLEEIPLTMAISSQNGVCKVKRNELAYRLFLSISQGKKVPQKRVKPSQKTLNVLQRLRIKCLRNVSMSSRENWIKSRKAYDQYNLHMKKTIKTIERIDKIYLLVKYVNIIRNKINKVFASKARGIGR